MITTTFSDEFKQELARDVVQQLVPILLRELKQNELPHLLSRQEFMEVAGVSATKCNELFNRQDFYPVTREFGHPKVVTKLFFEWLNETSKNTRGVNLQSSYRVV